MFETTIQFKPREQWRAGHDARQAGRGARPHRARCRACPTSGCRRSATASTCSPPASRARSASRSPGTDLQRDRPHRRARSSASSKSVPGVTSALAERLTGGRYIDVNIDRDAAARYGLNIADVQSIVSAAIGGDNIGETVEGLQRFPINVRYPRELRDSVEKLRDAAGRSPSAARRSAWATWRAIAHRRRPADAARARTRACRAGSTSTSAGATCSSAVHDMQQAVAQAGQAAGRLLDLVVGAVRVPGARHREAEDRRAGDAADHLRAAVPDVPARSTRRC